MNTREDRFSKKMMETPPSAIRKFFDLVIGRDDIITLGVGEPDFATPWVMREEAFYHIEKGHTSYTSNWGLLELREEIAKWVLPARWGLWYATIVAVVLFGAYGVGYTLVEMIYAGY